MIERDHLSEMSKWAGFVGIMTIIFGAVSALCGVFAFVVGAIPGIIMIVLGVKLRGAKRYADELLVSGSDNLVSINMLFSNLNTYFKIQGVLIIIYLIFLAIILLTGGLAVFKMML